MNDYLLTVNGDYKYRISEIEFYYNDLVEGKKVAAVLHPDTFTHGDEMQKLSGQWYFHKMNGKSYKVGTYKGLDLAFGKGQHAVGGILIRAITSVGAVNGKHLPPNEFIEGPCNTVSRILEHNTPTGQEKIKEVKDFVVLDNFTTDAFTAGSRLYLSKITPKDLNTLNLSWKAGGGASPLFRGPRVGLTLNRYDQYKPAYWLRDYRFVAYPEKHKKMAAFVQLGMMGSNHRLTVAEVVKLSGAKRSTVEELQAEMEKGRKEDKAIEHYKMTSKDMKNKDFAYAYGIHQRLHTAK